MSVYAGGFPLLACVKTVKRVKRQDLPARLEDDLCRFDDYTPLRLMNPLLKVFKRIFLLDLHGPHQHRLSAIDFPDDPVDHYTGVLDLTPPEGVEGSLDGVHPIKRTGESRVNVDDRDVPPLNLLQKRITQNVHPARQNDEIRGCGQHDLGNLVIVIVPRLARVSFEIGLKGQHLGLDWRVRGLGSREPVRRLAVRENEDYVGVREGLGALGIDQGLKICPWCLFGSE